MKNLLDENNYIESSIRRMELGDNLTEEILHRLRGDGLIHDYPYSVHCPHGISWVDHQMMTLPPGWYVQYRPTGRIPNVEGPFSEEEARAYVRKYWEERRAKKEDLPAFSRASHLS
jgi:hypothetical protein